jgi:hypothetical protein
LRFQTSRASKISIQIKPLQFLLLNSNFFLISRCFSSSQIVFFTYNIIAWRFRTKLELQMRSNKSPPEVKAAYKSR